MTIRPQSGLFAAGIVLIAAAVLLPIATVVVLAASPREEIWQHLLATTFPKYLRNTLVLMFAVGACSGAVGVICAWIVTMHRFPFRRHLEWALFLPISIPTYVGAFALVDFLEFAGPLQTGMRAIFGWQTSGDYYFPEIRSVGGAVFVLSASFYPYVYLLARAAFRELSGNVFEVATTLGANARKRFFLVALPLARPSIAIGIAIVMMETVSDFGAVNYFAVQTLTTGIFSVWLDAYNVGGAAQLSLVILALMFILLFVEKASRRRGRRYSSTKGSEPVEPAPLHGLPGCAAAAACLMPVAAGFLLPLGVMLSHTLDNLGALVDPGLIRALLNTVMVGALAAVSTVAAAVFMVFGVRSTHRRLPRLALPATTLGYATPGAVLGLGVLIPMAAADGFLADFVLAATGVEIGLLMTGSAFAIVFAYSVRFFAIAQGAADSAMGRIPPSLTMAARSLGKDAVGTLGSVHLPIIKGSLLTAWLLVFVDCVKELPATLLLRPFNFHTLATRVYESASLEDIGSAAPTSLLIMLVGSLGVAVLVRANR